MLDSTVGARPGWGRPLLILTGVVAASALASAWWFLRPTPAPAPTAPADPYPILPLSASPFRNTRPEVEYVGTAACVSCHPSEYWSYLRTGMGRSMAAVNPDREPPDAAYDHPASNRRFRVVRKGGKMHHQELLLTGGGEEVVLTDLPLTYVIGSGRHSRTYVAEPDGFTVESPITWYHAKQKWGMSPGYDKPDHLGFERPVEENCLHCHASRIEVRDGSLHRIQVVEAAIGCERCHGPGALHVARWSADDAEPLPPGAFDDTVVNPRHLGRELAEAVCQQCHLQSGSTVFARGRNTFDYRPGLPIQDVRMIFLLDDPEEGMTVTGHVEQLHQSKCYQKSGTLTCLTCHNPHAFPRPGRQAAHYRSACLSCHAEGACKVDPARRAAESPQNSCTQCHMPTSPTDIPHLAFSHHRIGIHAEKPATPRETRPFRDPRQRDTLAPLHDLSRYGEADRQRALGLAYLRQASGQDHPQVLDAYYGRAADLLSQAGATRLREPAFDTYRAVRGFYRGERGVRELAEAALTHPDIKIQEKCDALYLVAVAQKERRLYGSALETLKQLTQLRRRAPDWLLMGQCEEERGNGEEAARAFEKAVTINTYLTDLHQHLAQGYERRGNRERAAWHRQRIPSK